MSDLASNLERLNDLRKAGALTDDEFKAAKANLLIGGKEPANHSPDYPDSLAPSSYKSSKIPLMVVAAAGVFATAAAGAWYYSAAPSSALSVGSKDANCRVSPNAQANLKEILSAGTVVAAGTQSGGWTKIESNGCWVKNTLLTGSPSESSADVARPADQPSEPTIGPGFYRFDAGSGSSAAAIARHILDTSSQCVGRRAYGAGTTRVWLDFKEGMASSASITNFGQPMGDDASTGFKRNDLQIKSEEQTMDGGDEFEFYGLVKSADGDVMLLAHPHYGAAPKPPFQELTWQFYCGDEHSGSQARQTEFKNARSMITFEDRD